MKIGIVASGFNPKITKKMLDAALLEAKKQKVQVLHVVKVPGVLEIPLALKKLLKRKEIEGVACLGAVVQGQTEHDRLVAFTSAEKIISLSLESEKPVSMCISGPRITRKQGVARAKEYGKRSIETLIKLEKNLKNIG